MPWVAKFCQLYTAVHQVAHLDLITFITLPSSAVEYASVSVVDQSVGKKGSADLAAFILSELFSY